MSDKTTKPLRMYLRIVDSNGTEGKSHVDIQPVDDSGSLIEAECDKMIEAVIDRLSSPEANIGEMMNRLFKVAFEKYVKRVSEQEEEL